MRRLARSLRLALALPLLLAACSSKPDCNAPAHATYSCEPQDGGVEGCPPYDSPDAAGPIYPKGCVITLPFCPAFFPGSPQTCNCSDFPNVDGSTRLTWVCPS